MEYKIYLDYTRQLLNQLKISSYIIESPFLWDEQYDGGLRKTIFNDYTLSLHDALPISEERRVGKECIF